FPRVIVHVLGERETELEDFGTARWKLVVDAQSIAASEEDGLAGSNPGTLQLLVPLATGRANLEAPRRALDRSLQSDDAELLRSECDRRIATRRFDVER